MTYAFDTTRLSWVLTRNDLTHLIAALAACDEVVLDLETTGLFEHATTGGVLNGGVAARVVLASFTLPFPGDAPFTWVVPLSHPDSPFSGQWREVLRVLAATIRDNAKPVVGQNVRFDCRWITATTGVDLSRLLVWDTRVSSHLLDENTTTSLKPRAAATFEVDRWDDFDLSYPAAAEKVPLFDLGAYAARDTYWTWALADLHRHQMGVSGDDEDFWTMSDEEVEYARLGRFSQWCAMPTVATLTAVEQRGFRLDVGWTRERLAENRREETRLLASLVDRYPMEGVQGRPSFAPTSLWFKAWAEKALEAGDLRVVAMTPNGRPSWGKEVLRRLERNGYEVAAELLAYRRLIKQSEYLTAWIGFVAPDGAIHTNYNVGSVVTGRLSSDSPNMQQVTKELRPAFVPRDGYVLADLDYSQIELRIAAFVSRCKPMLEAFRRGDDLHTLFAARITEKPPGDVTPYERQAAKAGNFGLVFGMSPYGFQRYAEDVYGVVFTNEEAHAVHRLFFDLWTGMAEWHVRVVARAHQTSQVVSPIGRVRRLLSIHDRNDETVKYAERAAINAPVQGFASDLMQIASASIEGMLPDVEAVAGARIVATVHDSIVVEVPALDWKRVTAECVQRMTDVNTILRHLDCDFDVPLVVETKVGTRWGLSDVSDAAV